MVVGASVLAGAGVEVVVVVVVVVVVAVVGVVLTVVVVVALVVGGMVGRVVGLGVVVLVVVDVVMWATVVVGVEVVVDSLMGTQCRDTFLPGTGGLVGSVPGQHVSIFLVCTWVYEQKTHHNDSLCLCVAIVLWSYFDCTK